MHLQNTFDVIVVGGGHAGTEAALAASRMGATTLLITQNIETLGQLSCNPAIGGIGKSQLVKEIDALGGIMARAADKAGIHCRTLGTSKGYAVRSTRMQVDRNLYKAFIRHTLEDQPNLRIFQQNVIDLCLKGDSVTGVVTQLGSCFYAKAVILTVGTFLGGQIHVGDKNWTGGRSGEHASTGLTASLRGLPFHIRSLKTGTPARVDGSTLDYSVLAKQPGEQPPPYFSFYSNNAQRPQQVSCYIAHTNAHTHTIIRTHLNQSPLYTGKITGAGPRYCPSIEDKIVRFADKTSHHIFIEPEGLYTHECYLNGVSTSLPFEAQAAFIHSIAGLEKAHITRAGYAIEYDYLDPTDLYPSLQSKHIPGLFLAGQINGTTGYEEAAAQGLIAGLNATLHTQGKTPWYPKPEAAYIGVLLDDLTTKGTQEPYRMFTSRVAYRLSVREDNADARLTPIGHDLGLVSSEHWQLFCEKQQHITKTQQILSTIWITPNTPCARTLSTYLASPLDKPYLVLDLLKRPEINAKHLFQLESVRCAINHLPSPEVQAQIEIQVKYAGYIKRQAAEINRQQKYSHMRIPENLNYDTIAGLSHEVTEKLKKIRPRTLDQASRIPGVTQAAMTILLLYIKKQSNIPLE